MKGGLEIRIAFVTDGGREMGMGHVMRSLTLALEFAQHNDVLFVTSSNASVQKLIEARGFSVDFSNDNQESLNILSVNRAEIVIIDRVTVEEELARSIKDSIGARITVMDNETEANQWADVVVNGLLTREFNNEHYIDESMGTEYFCGPKYLILKPSFASYSKTTVPNPLDARRVLLAFGGSDPLNLTDRALRGLLAIQNREHEVDIILGPQFAYPEDIVGTIELYGAKDRIRLFHNVENSAELMWRSELIFSSPGLSMFEGLAAGSNVIASPQNELQRRVYDYFFRNYDKTPEIYRFFDESFMLAQTERKVQEMEIGSGRSDVVKAIIG